MGGQILLQKPPPSRPLLLGRRPNNEKIYDHPWSLLAPFPWETTRSSCIDFQECPKAREPLLVGKSSSPLDRTSKYKTSRDTIQTWTTRGHWAPSKDFYRLKIQLVLKTIIVNWDHFKEQIQRVEKGQVLWETFLRLYCVEKGSTLAVHCPCFFHTLVTRWLYP